MRIGRSPELRVNGIRHEHKVKIDANETFDEFGYAFGGTLVGRSPS